MFHPTPTRELKTVRRCAGTTTQLTVLAGTQTLALASVVWAGRDGLSVMM